MFGFAILAIGLLGMFFSPYKYLLSYMFAGMIYWLSIEAISFLLKAQNFSSANAYICSVGMSMVAVFIWIAITEPKRQKARAEIRAANYIEHTPLYDGDVPTSKG